MSEPTDAVTAFRLAATQVLEAYGSLRAAWKQLSSIEAYKHLDSQDHELLKQLMIARIQPINAFEFLAKTDGSGAIEILLLLYLGLGVNPDTKFGGYQFELSGMLVDFVETHGKQALRQLLRHPDFNTELLTDKRLIASVSEALSIHERNFGDWLHSN